MTSSSGGKSGKSRIDPDGDGVSVSAAVGQLHGE